MKTEDMIKKVVEATAELFVEYCRFCKKVECEMQNLSLLEALLENEISEGGANIPAHSDNVQEYAVVVGVMEPLRALHEAIGRLQTEVPSSPAVRAQRRPLTHVALPHQPQEAAPLEHLDFPGVSTFDHAAWVGQRLTIPIPIEQKTEKIEYAEMSETGEVTRITFEVSLDFKNFGLKVVETNPKT